MSYIGNQPTPQSLESRQEFTATASQTTFATSGYTVGYVDVYLNGVKLSTSDFTATNGSDVVLGSGAAAGDVLAVVMKNDHSDLVALPITDSQGNNVLSETNNVVSIGSGVVFPAGIIINTDTGLLTSSDTTTANNNTGTSGFNTGLTVDLNVSSNSNYVLVIANVNWAYDTGNDSKLTIQATKSGQTTVEIAKSLQYGLGNYHAISVALGGKFTPAVSGVWTFTVYGQSAGNMGINAQNGSGSTITDLDALALVSSITAFEVQL